MLKGGIQRSVACSWLNCYLLLFHNKVFHKNMKLPNTYSKVYISDQTYCQSLFELEIWLWLKLDYGNWQITFTKTFPILRVIPTPKYTLQSKSYCYKWDNRDPITSIRSSNHWLVISNSKQEQLQKNQVRKKGEIQRSK